MFPEASWDSQGNEDAGLPRRFLPLHLVAVPDELLHLGEERMGLVRVIPDLLAQDELHPLGRRRDCKFQTSHRETFPRARSFLDTELVNASAATGTLSFPHS